MNGWGINDCVIESYFCKVGGGVGVGEGGEIGRELGFFFVI